MSPHRLDGRTEKAGDRRLLTFIALAIIAMSCILGVAYLGIWQRASEDLSRLLPASTRAYLQVPTPWKGMNQALRHGPWRDRAEVRDALREDGYLAKPPPGDLAGLPLETVRDILRNASGLELALVPSSGADTMMVFVELDESMQRRRIVSRLKPLVTSVDRHAGFRIESLKELEWHRYLGYASPRPLLVDMAPWLVFAWGNPQGLEELLDARVGGRYDALYRRPGFVASGRSSTSDALRLVIDATSAWRLATREERPRPGGLVERLDLLTLESDTENATRLEAELSDSDFAAVLGRALARSPDRPSLPDLTPSDAVAVFSLRSPSLKRLLSLLALLDFGLRRDFAPGAAPNGLAMTLRTDPEDLPDTAVELALVLLPAEGEPEGAPSVPLVLIRPTSPESLATALSNAWPRLFGDGFAIGNVRLGSGTATIIRPELAVAMPISGAPSETQTELGFEAPDPRDGIAWRLRDGILELAPDAETLVRFERAERRLRDSTKFVAQARALDPSAPIWLLLNSEALSLLGPLGSLMESRVSAEHWLGATAEAVESHLELASPTGLWPLLVTLVGASRRDFDSLTLEGLEPRCASSYLAFCELYPNAIPCRPFDSGHRSRIDELCLHLQTTPH